MQMYQMLKAVYPDSSNPVLLRHFNSAATPELRSPYISPPRGAIFSTGKQHILRKQIATTDGAMMAISSGPLSRKMNDSVRIESVGGVLQKPAIGVYMGTHISTKSILRPEIMDKIQA